MQLIDFYPPTTWSASALSRVSEVTTSIRRFGKSMLKNKYHANVRMAAVLITLFRQLSSAVNESYWPCFFGRVSVFSSLFINTPKTA